MSEAVIQNIFIFAFIVKYLFMCVYILDWMATVQRFHHIDFSCLKWINHDGPFKEGLMVDTCRVDAKGHQISKFIFTS